MPTPASQQGLLWEENIWGALEPTWTIEPSISSIRTIARRELNIPHNASCDITFLAQGAFNKVYTISTNRTTSHVMRISLPVDPVFKTLSEVATISYVREHTSIPAPKVIAYSASNENELGFEWMIQEYVSGQKLEDAWREMSWLKKEMVVMKVIGYLVEMFEKRFSGLGNLYKTEDLQKMKTAELPDIKLLGREHKIGKEGTCLGRVVSMPLFWGKHLDCDIQRGPYTNSREWLHAQLQLHVFDLENSPDSDSEDENDTPCAGALATTPSAFSHRASRISALIDRIFPPNSTESFTLHHSDLNSSNILLDPHSSLSSIIDWECIHTIPLSSACRIPKFLDTVMDRHVCPDPSAYSRATAPDGTVTMNEMYYEHLEEYENTQLWKFFLEEMGRVCPEWVGEYEKGKVKAGLKDAVAQFGDDLAATVIDEWLDNVEGTGGSASLQELARRRQRRLDNPGMGDEEE